MKTLLITVLCVLFCSSLAFAQYPGSIGLFTDQAASGCSAYDIPGQPLFVWVVHMYSPGATASEFRVETPSCLLWLADYPDQLFIAFGGFRDGISIAYKNCLASPIVLGYMMFLPQGSCFPCTYMRVVDHPYPSASTPGIWAYDCALPVANMMQTTGGEFIINPGPSCNCDIPAEETTWGQIKALY